eukprot:Gb_30849 [translate_table: standard]
MEINPLKSSIYFYRVPQATRVMILKFLPFWVGHIEECFRYLGFMMKANDYQYKDWIWLYDKETPWRTPGINGTRPKFIALPLNVVSPLVFDKKTPHCFCDGASRGNPGLSGAGGHILFNGRLVSFKRVMGTNNNNYDEVIALIIAMGIALEEGI